MPLLLIRRHAETLNYNARQDFDDCIKNAAEELQGKVGFDSARINCVGHYKQDLKRHMPIVANYY